MRYSFRSLARPLAVLSIALAGTSAASAQSVMDFTQIACATGEYNSIGPTYTEDGFTLVTQGTFSGFTTWCADHASYAGAGMYIDAPTEIGDETALLTKSDGGTFSIDAIDLAHLYAGAYGARSYTFIGTFADGTTVSQTFEIGAQDGSPTFTTYGFGATWTNLLSVEFARQRYSYYQFTNVLLDGATTIPEPASMILLGTGLVGVFGVGAVRRRRRNESA